MLEKPSPEVTPLACVILAAGQGTRMKSTLPKVLHHVAGKTMIKHVIEACAALRPEIIVVVTAPDGEAVRAAIAPASSVVQLKPLGTAHAANAAQDALRGFNGDIIVLFGDTPLVTHDALEQLRTKRKNSKAAVVVAGFQPTDPGPYGRLVQDDKNNLVAIVEAKDATADELKIGLCNGGIMLFAEGKLWPLLDQVRNDNAKKEFYLTDCIALARNQGDICVVAEMTADQVLGINTRVELAEAEKHMQARLRRKAMLNGATLLDPDTVYFSADTVLGRDVVVGPSVVFGPGVIVGDRVEIRAFSYLEHVRIDAAALIGPFARIRPGTTVGAGAHVGNFVELKNTEVSPDAKIHHVSYIGDTFVGSKANIGAGTITCNYDGFRKHRTHIGEGTFIGSNSSLVAPVNIGEGAYVGAGSVITMDVPANTLAVARGRQSNIQDWAARSRDEKKNER